MKRTGFTTSWARCYEKCCEVVTVILALWKPLHPLQLRQKLSPRVGLRLGRNIPHIHLKRIGAGVAAGALKWL